MAIPSIDVGPMTVDEFHAFTDTRPDDEKWELIGGEPILNASPNPPHQRIVRNVLRTLDVVQEDLAAPWEVLPGLGVRVSDTDQPEPDLLVVPLQSSSAEIDTRQVIVAFEVLSPWTRRRDLTWKRTAYQSLPSLTHYIVIAQDAVEAIVFARNENFAGRMLSFLEDTIDLDSLGVWLPLARIYRGMELTA